jgi:hypothetical protein
MNRRSFLKGLIGGAAALAVTDPVAIAEALERKFTVQLDSTMISPSRVMDWHAGPYDASTHDFARWVAAHEPHTYPFSDAIYNFPQRFDSSGTTTIYVGQSYQPVFLPYGRPIWDMLLDDAERDAKNAYLAEVMRDVRLEREARFLHGAD